ncbi:hypothetical protein [Saccharomonospora sp.]|uniref:sunset domain-containing protein n=1 Tax=Saccharomonospora sp. TaxID=33913 RepID=UPI0026273CE5|nr:hypothetical protein [Saccharomonospora sp.]
MSVFGQVWVFSAIAFVLGALLAWLFLVRPAQRRIGELQRRLADVERAPSGAASRRGTASGGAQSTLIAPPAAEDDEDETRGTPPTRRFEPATESQPEPPADKATERLAPAPKWPEQDSLRGRTSSAQSSEVDELDEEFARIKEFENEHSDEPGEMFSSDDSGSDEPTEYRSSHAGQLDVDLPAAEADDIGDADSGSRTRRSASLFEPASPTGASDGPDTAEDESTSPRYGIGGGPDKAADPPATERTTMLPKRQPGRSSLESFERAKPIQPSMRPVERREPQSEPGRGGSLFEPTVSPSNVAPPARDSSLRSDLPPGPFGPGSAMPKPGGERPSPDFTVKASVTALRYCPEGSPEFPRMVAEVWFRSPADAERVGFRPLS